MWRPDRRDGYYVGYKRFEQNSVHENCRAFLDCVHFFTFLPPSFHWTLKVTRWQTTSPPSPPSPPPPPPFAGRGHFLDLDFFLLPGLSKLHEDARRSSKDFQQFWYELEMFKVCRDDMPCEVKKPTIWWVFGGGWKSGKIHWVTRSKKWIQTWQNEQ